jgi:hypothetical protein
MGYDEARAASYDTAHAAHFAEAEAVVDGLLSLLPATAGERERRVLELGRGVEVWGVDDSPAMVDRLQAKPGGDLVRVALGDFAAVGNLVDGPFDLVFVAFNTLFELPTQDAQVRCIEDAAGILAETGVLAIEAIAPDLTRLDQTVAALALTADTAVLQATRHDPSTQQVVGADVTVGAGGTLSLSPWSLRYASVPELDLMARLAGLHLRHRWGSWYGEPFTAASPAHVSVYGRPTRVEVP